MREGRYAEWQSPPPDGPPWANAAKVVVHPKNGGVQPDHHMACGDLYRGAGGLTS